MSLLSLLLWLGYCSLGGDAVSPVKHVIPKITNPAVEVVVLVLTLGGTFLCCCLLLVVASYCSARVALRRESIAAFQRALQEMQRV